MPEAWSSKYDRERSKEERRREEVEGTKAREAKKQAEDAFSDQSDESRGRRVAD